MKVKKFNDNSKITWISRESILYEKGGHSVEIWIDWYEIGWFSSKRVIKMDSLKEWDTIPYNHSKTINKEEQEDIIQKINSYFGKKCLIE